MGQLTQLPMASVSSASHTISVPTYAFASIFTMPYRLLYLVTSTFIICQVSTCKQSGWHCQCRQNCQCSGSCKHSDWQAAPIAMQDGLQKLMRLQGTYQCVTWHNWLAKSAFLNAPKEKVLLGSLVFTVHHNNTAKLSHGLHLQHPCAATGFEAARFFQNGAQGSCLAMCCP